MTPMSASITSDEWRELCDAAHERFISREIDEAEYRRLLGGLGFNASSIEEELRYRKEMREGRW